MYQFKNDSFTDINIITVSNSKVRIMILPTALYEIIFPSTTNCSDASISTPFLKQIFYLT